jgi:hypothetical protein
LKQLVDFFIPCPNGIKRRFISRFVAPALSRQRQILHHSSSQLGHDLSPLFVFVGPQAVENRIMTSRYLNRAAIKKDSPEESCPIPV